MCNILHGYCVSDVCCILKPYTKMRVRVCICNVVLYVCNQIQHQRHKTRQRDSKKNHDRMASIRQAPRHLQK